MFYCRLFNRFESRVVVSLNSLLGIVWAVKFCLIFVSTRQAESFCCECDQDFFVSFPLVIVAKEYCQFEVA